MEPLKARKIPNITNSPQTETRAKRAGIHWFYFILVLMNSGIIFLSDHKRVGIPFSKELYLACLSVIVIWLILRHQYWFSKFASVNIPILVYVLLTFSLPAIFAYIKFDQPLIYGLLEERRTLYLLVFFPVFYGLCVKDISPSELIKYIKISAALCVTTAFLYYFGILHLNTSIFFAQNDLTAKHTWDLRYATRFVVGTNTIIFATLLILVQMTKSKISLFDFLLLIASLAYLYFLNQSRLDMALILCVGIFLLFTNMEFFKLSIIPIAFSILVLVCLYIGTDILQAPLEKFSFLLDDASQPFVNRVRYTTGVIIFHELMDNYFLGMGSLSNQWNLGFASYYSKDFYLNDVGLPGVLYRFGILTFGIVFLYFYIFKSALRGTHSFEMKTLAWIYIINTLVLFYFNAYIIKGGQATGLLLALLYYENISSKVDHGREGQAG